MPDLTGLKIGDVFIVDSRVETVSRLTATQFVAESGLRFRRSDGYPIGRAGVRAEAATPEGLARCERHAAAVVTARVARDVSRVLGRLASGWGRLDADGLNAISDEVHTLATKMHDAGMMGVR
jgi:hypothetical protein